MGGTKCLRLGTCELKDMGGVLQKNSSITVRPRPGTPEAPPPRGGYVPCQPHR